MRILVMYGYEFAGHNHDLVYETSVEEFTDFDENMIGYYHDEGGNAWLGYVIAICDNDFEFTNYDIGVLILLKAQNKIKEVYNQYFNGIELIDNFAKLQIIRMDD